MEFNVFEGTYMEAADKAITEFVEQHRDHKDNGLPEMKFTWDFEKKRWKRFGELTPEDKKIITIGLKAKLLHTVPYFPRKGLKCRKWKDNDQVIVLINDEFYYDSDDFDMSQAHTLYGR